jgi:hypothetical protein
VRRPSIVEFVTDPHLLGLSLSPAQETLLRRIYHLPLVDEEQREVSRLCTGGREVFPAHGFGEVTVLAGARAGKDSRIAAPIVCFEALFGGHEKHLARGERAVIPVVAQDARATKIAFGYVKDYFTGSKLLASRVEEVLSLEIVLTNRVTIQTFPCTLKSLRGWSVPAGVMDELGFWRLEGQADSDVEVQASIRRGMLSFPSPRLVKISTPYMKSGVLFEDFKAAFGKDDADRLVWRAASVLMNPSLRAERLERERRLDPSRFAREYEAEFAEDLDAFLPAAWVDAAIVPGRHELPPLDGVSYYAAVDASGGGADAFTLSIVHTEGEASSRRVVQDVMRGWRGSRSGSVDLEGIVGEIVEVLRPYHVGTVKGDRYSAGWVRQAFERHQIQYVTADDKATAYLAVEPLFAQGRIEVLDHPQLVRELKNLERRPRPGGKVLVDHPHGQHDDHANALALAAAAATKSEGAWPEDLGPFSIGSRTSPWNVGGPSIDVDTGERITSVGGIDYIGAVPASGPSTGRRGRRWSMG